MTTFARLLVLAFGVSLVGGCGGGGSGAGGSVSGPATQLSVSGPAASGAGIAFILTVAARDASSNVAAGYSGTVHFTSSDPAAALPPDSTLVNGTANFPVTLASAGFQTVTATDSVSASIQGAASVTAIASAFPVDSFGARGDGLTDDTAAIQKAITAAGTAGGGTVLFSVARYYTAGTLNVPAGVVLRGMTEGPFDVAAADPGVTTIASTLLITSTGGPFLTLQGAGAGVTDLLFHYPKQVRSTAAAPDAYPYTILVNGAGARIARSTASNAYDFLDIEAGAVRAQDLFIGAFHTGVNVDHARGRVTLSNLFNQVFWDVLENAVYPSPIDTWVLANGTALVVGRADGLEVHDFALFSRFTGILLTDSSDKSQNPACGYGTGSDIDLDTVQYGIVVAASNSPGYKFTNVDIGAAPGLGQAAVQVRPGGSLPPKIEINGGSQRGNWAIYAYPPTAPGTAIVNILP